MYFFKCCIQSLLYESKLSLDLYIKQLCILFYAMDSKSVFILTEKNNQQKMSFVEVNNHVKLKSKIHIVIYILLIWNVLILKCTTNFLKDRLQAELNFHVKKCEQISSRITAKVR